MQCRNFKITWLFMTDKDTILMSDAGCEIMVGHRTRPTNLAQRPIKKRVSFAFNGRTMPVGKLFVFKP